MENQEAHQNTLSFPNNDTSTKSVYLAITEIGKKVIPVFLGGTAVDYQFIPTFKYKT